MKSVYMEDAVSIASLESIEWEKFKRKTFLITGSTGLIGTTIINALVIANNMRNLNLRIICIVRSLEKAQRKLPKSDAIILKIDSIEEKIKIDGDIDFIIHTANPTSSSFFINSPVETIKTAIKGTMNLLDLSIEKSIKSFVFLSSMEVYGYPDKGHIVTEKEIAGFDTLVVRNCYPISKQMCESLCKAYQSEYGVSTKILRLTQTFGPGVEFSDNRVFAEFMRCAIKKQNITLRTMGSTERCYLYTADAASAILIVLTKGEPGESYTVANSDTYCSILDMAKLVAEEITNSDIMVQVEMDGVDRGHADELHMLLDTTKIQALGWKASMGLKDMFERMIEGLQKNLEGYESL